LTEDKDGQQVNTPVQADNVDPAQTASDSQTQDKYSGKSVEELKHMHSELEGKLGQQSNELGELRQAVQYQQQYLQQATQPGQSQVEPDRTQVELTDETFYDKPLASTKKVVEDVVGQKLGQFMQVQEEQRANVSFEQGFNQALNKEPDKFKGNEAAVRQLVEYQYRQMKNQNPYLQPEILSQPQIWDAALAAAKVGSGEYQIVPKGYSPTPQAMQPTGTEIPGSNMPQTNFDDGSFRIDEQTREMMKGFDLSEKEARELVKAEREGK